MKTNTNENIIHEKSLREEIGKHRDKAFDIINKVGGLMLLDNESLAPLNEVARFYNVTRDTIKMLIRNNKKEFQKTGIKVVSGRDVINSVGKNNLPTEIEQKNGYKLITIGERSAKIANGRNMMLTKDSIIRVGMMLRDSEVAREFRDQATEILKRADVNTIVEVKDDQLRKKAELYDKMTDGVPKMAQESLLTTIEHYQATIRELERKAEQELQEERQKTQDAKAARKKAEENTKLFEQLATETGEKLEGVVKDLEKARRKSDLFDRYIDSGLNMTLQEFCKRYLDGIKTKLFIAWLQSDGILYENRNTNAVYRTRKGFEQWLINVPVKQYNNAMKTTLMITPSGVVKLAQKYVGDPRLNESWIEFGN
ncbi:phage antirepressor KilAC domain-containing protein [Bacillus cereus group sp. N28]|uniref:phage antirepressor KilAC domain-containing protein n=1 Tax=Bacillus cereus group sp. N28 TaxID=2794593 RepID=UPI0018F70906|nr:phage antirepressor KilAC domain-containing protein [Bacillus cereus group sp. N28]MBJ7957205.1 phage antirepressor KilAC domain-containing protein [Bacillus cereus group sp. N28]